jgi:hypothetical protein
MAVMGGGAMLRAKPAGGIMHRRIKLAPYLSGTIYRMLTEAGMFIFFNSLPIARRAADEEAWTVIALSPAALPPFPPRDRSTALTVSCGNLAARR